MQYINRLGHLIIRTLIYFYCLLKTTFILQSLLLWALFPWVKMSSWVFCFGLSVSTEVLHNKRFLSISCFLIHFRCAHRWEVTRVWSKQVSTPGRREPLFKAGLTSNYSDASKDGRKLGKHSNLKKEKLYSSHFTMTDQKSLQIFFRRFSFYFMTAKVLQNILQKRYSSSRYWLWWSSEAGSRSE